MTTKIKFLEGKKQKILKKKTLLILPNQNYGNTFQMLVMMGMTPKRRRISIKYMEICSDS